MQVVRFFPYSPVIISLPISLQFSCGGQLFFLNNGSIYNCTFFKYIIEYNIEIRHITQPFAEVGAEGIDYLILCGGG